jgi:hypothetical protein
MNQPTTYHILFKAAGSAHYAKAGSHAASGPIKPGMDIEVEFDGRRRHGIIDQVFIPPGCDEHCIGNIFAHEAAT